MKSTKAIIIIIISVIACIMLITTGVIFAVKSVRKERIAESPKIEGISFINKSDLSNAKLENGEKVNTSSKVKEEKTVKGLKITNVEVKTENNSSFFKASVENLSGKKVNETYAELKILNSKGEAYDVLTIIIPELEVNDKGTIESSTNTDITNAYDYIIEFNN